MPRPANQDTALPHLLLRRMQFRVYPSQSCGRQKNSAAKASADTRFKLTLDRMKIKPDYFLMSPIEQSNPVSSGENPQCCRIHFYYIVGILVAIIIFLCTWNFSNQEKLANALNFALGLTSMVLAVLAIVYAFVANNAFAGTVSKIESAAASIKKETAQLDQSLHKMEVVVKSIPESLAKIAGGVDRTNKILESQPKSELPPQPQENDEKVKAFAISVIDRFMLSTSWNGLKLLFLCDLAAKAHLKFDLRDWTAKDTVTSFDYAYGFIVAAASAGFVSMIDDNGIVTIHSVPALVSEKAAAEINKRMGNEIVAQQWAKQVKAINDFVAQQSIQQQK
jgi:hypothetical protein